MWAARQLRAPLQHILAYVRVSCFAPALKLLWPPQPSLAAVGQWPRDPLEAMTDMLDRSLNFLRGPAT